MQNIIEKLYSIFLQSAGITTDTRKVQPSQLFFALKGDKYDGNQFAKIAIENGAKYAIIDNLEYKINEQYILVDNTLETLQQLALYHRRKMPLKALVSITGSNGKTTTKELLHAVIAQHYTTLATQGNLNNHIGIPLTLLQIKNNIEIAIVEMGANHQKEIASYCTYVEPTHGIITNIGKAHIEGFGGVEGIKKGKGELYDYLAKENGIVIYNADDSVINNMIAERKFKHKYYYSADDIKLLEEYPNIVLELDNTTIKTNLFGKYNLYNILCAIRVGQLFDVPTHKIKKGIEEYMPNNKRSEFVSKDDYKLILDYYNANPTSMQHALENFSLSQNTNRIVILGDMFELGDTTLEEHQFIANLAEQLGFEKIVLVGKNFKQTNTNYALKLDTSDEAKKWFQTIEKSNAEILIKGSRGMQMENILSC